MKKKILITGSSVNGNLGAGAMTLTLIDYLVNKLKYDVEQIGILTHRYDLDSKLIKKNNFKIFKYGGIIRKTLFNVVLAKIIKRNVLKKNDTQLAFEWCDIIIDIHGINFCETDNLTSSILIPGFMIWVADMLNKKTIKFTQTFGPISNYFKRYIARFFLKKALLLIPREKESYDFLKSLKLKNTTRPYTDSAFNLQRRKFFKNPNFLKEKNLFRIGFIPSAIMHGKTGSEYIKYCKDLIKSIELNSRQIIIFCHLTLENKNGKVNSDFQIAKEVYKEFKNNKSIILFEKKYDPSEVKYLISKMDCILSSRYHSIISSISSNVPPYVLGWNYKYDSILKKVGMSKYGIRVKDIQTKTKLTRLDNFLKENNNLKSKLIKINSYLSRDSDSAFNLLKKYI